MKIAIIINAKRLTDELASVLYSDALTQKYNITYDLFIKEPQELESTIKSINFQTYNACIVGGGDGTIRTAAKYIMKQGIPLAILPLGTFNLLAKSLDHPNDIDALFSMIKNKKTKQIDLAEVNGHFIINHLWIGFYYHLLKSREKHKKILGRNKLLKIIFNTINLFKVLPIYTLTFKVNNQIVTHESCLVFIGNNESYTNFFDFGEHKTLSTGLLSVNILNCKSRWQLFSFIINLLFTNKFKESKYVTSFSTTNLVITAKKPLVKTVIDGELFEINNPLNFEIHQKKLMVVIP